MRYIELNPVRAGLVARPEDYPWSSYRSQAGDAALNGLTEPEKYRRLGASSDARALAFFALRFGKFQKEIEAMTGRRARIVPQCRPRKL